MRDKSLRKVLYVLRAGIPSVPSGGNTQTTIMSLWTSIPQQRRYTTFDIQSSCRRRRGTLEAIGLSLAGFPPGGRSLNRKFPKRVPATFTHGLVGARIKPAY